MHLKLLVPFSLLFAGVFAHDYGHPSEPQGYEPTTLATVDYPAPSQTPYYQPTTSETIDYPPPSDTPDYPYPSETPDYQTTTPTVDYPYPSETPDYQTTTDSYTTDVPTYPTTTITPTEPTYTVTESTTTSTPTCPSGSPNQVVITSNSQIKAGTPFNITWTSPKPDPKRDNVEARVELWALNGGPVNSPIRLFQSDRLFNVDSFSYTAPESYINATKTGGAILFQLTVLVFSTYYPSSGFELESWNLPYYGLQSVKFV